METNANDAYRDARERPVVSAMEVRHPEVEVRLVGGDGNAYAILGRVLRALRRAGVPREERDEFTREATSGDYDHLLQTCLRWVRCT